MGKKKTKARIQELRDLLAETAAAQGAILAEASTLKKKKRAAAEETLAELKKTRKKAFRELEKIAPGRFDADGWDLAVPAPFTKEDTEAGQRAVLNGKTLEEHERAEAKAAGERHLAHLARIEGILERRHDLEDAIAAEDKKKKRAILQEEHEALGQELADLRKATEERTKKVAHETAGNAVVDWTPPKMRGDETDEELKARVQAKRAAREAATGDSLREPTSDSGRTEAEVETWLDKEGETPTTLEKKPKKKATRPLHIDGNGDVGGAGLEPKPKKKKGAKKLIEGLSDDPGLPEGGWAATADEAPETDGTTVAPEKVLEDVQPELRRDRWDRPLILTPEGKEEGYRRVTTYIDVLEDKTTLVDWKQRVVVVGVAAIEQVAAGEGLVGVEEGESVLRRVEAANILFAQHMLSARKRLKKGQIDSATYDDIVQQIEREQKATLNDLVAEAFKAGDGFLKAEAGTRLHYLAECVDTGQPLPDDVTDLEIRDLEALKDAYRQLDLRVLDVERFVVHDGYKAGGTLDRRVSYVSPSLGRRVTAIGDIKTGRMDYGSAKMARQCAMYGASKGYDPAKPEERVNLRCNQQVALIFHLPAGSGVCTVYELDLTLGHKGLKLCQAVYDYRAETSTLKKVTAAKDGKGIAVGHAALVEKVEAE